MSFMEALSMFWRMWWHGETRGKSPIEESLESLISTDVTGAIKMAMDKLKQEPVYPGRPRLWDLADGNRKKNEVKAWAYKYAKEMGHAEESISQWHINFMIEYLVGLEKGKLIDVSTR